MTVRLPRPRSSDYADSAVTVYDASGTPIQTLSMADWRAARPLPRCRHGRTACFSCRAKLCAEPTHALT